MDTIKAVDDIFNKVDEEMDIMTPRDLSQIIVELSVYLGKMGDMLATTNIKYSKIWLRLRETTKSDKHADIAAGTTETYKHRKVLKMKISATTELINSLKKRIEVLNNEARNQY